MPSNEYVNSGDPFRVRAGTWNDIIKSKDSYLKSRGGGADFDVSDWSDFVPVKNESGADIPDLTAVRITDVKIDPRDHLSSARSTPVLKGEGLSVSADYNSGNNIGIAQHPIKNGSIGMVQFSGMTLAKIHVFNENDDLVTPKSHQGVLKLTSCSYGETGSRIVWKESGTGDDKLAYINLGQFRSRYCSLIRGRLASSLSTTHGTVTGDSLHGIDGLIRKDDDDAGQITLVNNFSWDGDDNAYFVAAWEVSTSAVTNSLWTIIQLDCPES